MSHKSLSEGLAAALIRAHDYRQRTGSEPGGEEATRFSIAISREPGAQGTAVARALGQRLGWSVYDQELLDQVSKEMGTHVDLLKLIDEKPISWLEQAVVNLVAAYNLNQDTYMVHLIATVRALGHRGHCVIVGRGANFILPSETTLHVRLVGDSKDRVANIKRLLNLSDKDAGRWVEKTQHERHDFVRRYFGKNVDDPTLYDLVLNTSRLSVNESAEVIIAALQRLQARNLSARK